MTSFPPVLLSLWNDLQDARVLWQFLVIALSLGGAAWIANTAWPRLFGAKRGDAPIEGALSGVGFPLIALLLVLIGRWLSFAPATRCRGMYSRQARCMRWRRAPFPG